MAILLFADNLTKYNQCLAILDMTAETVARALFEEIVCQYGIPEKFLTHQESYYQFF